MTIITNEGTEQFDQKPFNGIELKLEQYSTKSQQTRAVYYVQQCYFSHFLILEIFNGILIKWTM